MTAIYFFKNRFCFLGFFCFFLFGDKNIPIRELNIGIFFKVNNKDIRTT